MNSINSPKIQQFQQKYPSKLLVDIIENYLIQLEECVLIKYTKIENAVCDIYKINRDDLVYNKRNTKPADARKLLIFILHYFTNIPKKTILLLLNCTDQYYRNRLDETRFRLKHKMQFGEFWGKYLLLHELLIDLKINNYGTK
jgi:hypothetical protein